MKKDQLIGISIGLIIIALFLTAIALLTSCALVYPKQQLPDETKYQKAKRECEAKPDPCACYDSTMRVPTFKSKHKKISNI